MDPMAFFDCTKKLEKIPIHRGARKEYGWKVPGASTTDSLCGSMRTQATIASGTDYADEYIKMEEKELFEASQHFQNEQGNMYEDVSLATAATPIQEILNEDITRLYKTYKFGRHPMKANLTIKTVHDKIISTVEGEPVTIIQGPTGCGKTTQVPQFILDNAVEKKRPCNIIVTQPRRIAALSIAKRVCQERQWPLGSLVGYKVGLSSCTSDDTRLTYCTTGVLLQRLIGVKHMNDFTHIIIDEVHERDQEMDFLLLVVRKLLRTNSRNVKVILMSATFNVDKFAKYFSSFVGQNLTPAPIIDVTKRNYFNVSDFYLCDIDTLGQTPIPLLKEPEASEPMMVYCASLMTVMDTMDENDERNQDISRPSILIFLPGIHEIEEMHNILTNEKFAACKWDIVVLHSSITNEEQYRVFDSPSEGFRRVILSTNIAESSITVPDVKYVIDFCLTKQLTTDPSTNYQCLELTWASKANCQQRAGRTGRVMDGRVYRLVTKSLYKELPDENPPEMTKAPLEIIVLRAKMLDLDKPKALLALALDPPDLSNLERTVLLLKESGGLLNVDDDHFDGDLTDLGRVMAQLPIDIHISKMIVLGHVFSVLRETIIIGASMAVKNMFSTPFQHKLSAYNAKIMWAQNTSSDPGAFLHAYSVWMREKANGRLKTSAAEKIWAQRHCLQIRVLREVDALIHELTNRLERLGIKETVGIKKVTWEESERNFVIKVVFAGGFYPHYFVTQPMSDETSKIKLLGGMDPMKTVYLQGWPARQPGMLYARRFQDAFLECLSSNAGKIKVKFDNSTRVYIQFSQGAFENEESLEMPGEISLAVYRALKSRLIGKRISIPVLTPDASNEQADALGIEKCAPILHFTTADSKPKKAPENEIRPSLPGLDISYVRIIMRRVVDPGHFWVCMKDPEAWGNWSRIENYIASLKINDLKGFESSPPIGTLLLAPYEVNGTTKLHRAIVQGISMETKKNVLIQVSFVDSGNVMRLQMSNLLRLPEGNPIAKIPALAFECVLSNLRPSLLNTLTGEWSKDAKRNFYSILKDKKELYGEIYSVVNSVVSITLIYVNQSGEKINVNELLIKDGFAEYREEDYLSKYNHELRQHALELSSAEKLNHEAMQYNQNYLMDNYVEPPAEKDCKSEVFMRGPFSPLEINLASLVNAGIGRKVSIADSSVNSVLLDSTLVDPKERLMVAGTVGQSAITNNLNLRNTTLMPNIPGLTALLCLIFAPQIELRRNSFKTRYSGALCGLGYEKSTQRGLFPEHDLGIHFDVEITIADLQNINRLRHWMSAGIFVSDGPDDTDEIAICQSKVKEILFKIIDKKREPIPEEPDLHLGAWCRYDPELFLVPGTVAQLKQNIFKLHHGLDLEEKNEAKEALIQHLDELKSMAAQSYKDSTATVIHCQLCKKEVFGILQLRTHIHSGEHRSKENQARRY